MFSSTNHVEKVLAAFRGTTGGEMSNFDPKGPFFAVSRHFGCRRAQKRQVERQRLFEDEKRSERALNIPWLS